MALLETGRPNTALQVLISPGTARSFPDTSAVSVNVVIPQSRQNIHKQIAALEYVLLNDKNEKDRQIHTQALESLKKALERR
jgi:hypothetical protein